jgi:hypothetical protein
LRNPYVDWGKAREFSVDFNNEVAIRQIGVEEMVFKYLKRTMSNTLDFISIAALPGAHTFFLNVNSLDSRSPRCTGYSGAKLKLSINNKLLIYKVILKPILTYGIQLCTTSNSNIEILERFQSKVLRLIVDAPWYVSNYVIRNDLQIRVPTFKEEISRFSSHYNARVSVHPNELIAPLTEPPIQRRLHRYWPHDLLFRF